MLRRHSVDDNLKVHMRTWYTENRAILQSVTFNDCMIVEFVENRAKHSAVSKSQSVTGYCKYIVVRHRSYMGFEVRLGFGCCSAYIYFGFLKQTAIYYLKVNLLTLFDTKKTLFVT